MSPLGRCTMTQPMGTSSAARACLAQAMAWCIQVSALMMTLYVESGTGMEKCHERSGGDEQAEDQQAQRFAQGFAPDNSEIPSADSAHTRQIRQNESDPRRRMRIEIFRLDCGEANKHHKQRQRDRAVADL